MTDAVELLYEESDDIGVITLHRPEARNALTFSMYGALERAVRESNARCLVSPAPTRPSARATTCAR